MIHTQQDHFRHIAVGAFERRSKQLNSVYIACFTLPARLPSASQLTLLDSLSKHSQASILAPTSTSGDNARRDTSHVFTHKSYTPLTSIVDAARDNAGMLQVDVENLLPIPNAKPWCVKHG